MPGSYWCFRPSPNLVGQSHTTIVIGRLFSITWGKRGDIGGWYWRCWRIREQWCGPMVWCTSQCNRHCFCTAEKVWWWRGLCWISWRCFTTGRLDGLQGWRRNVWQTGRGNIPRWWRFYNQRAYTPCRSKFGDGSKPSRHSWNFNPYMRSVTRQSVGWRRSRWLYGGIRNWYNNMKSRWRICFNVT